MSSVYVCPLIRRVVEMVPGDEFASDVSVVSSWSFKLCSLLLCAVWQLCDAGRSTQAGRLQAGSHFHRSREGPVGRWMLEQRTVDSVLFFGPCFDVSSFGCFMDVITEADVSDAIREMTRKRR